MSDPVTKTAFMNQVELFNEFRPLLFSIAYRMLGTVMEAEDILQETFLRWQRAPVEEVEMPKSYLSAIVTRLSIDYLRSARSQREEYIGPWLPEPLVTDPSADPGQMLALSESLSTAFLVILESLKPVERAVFLLREVFDYDYPAIAHIVGKSEANCRQILSRARRKISADRPRFEVSPSEQSQAVKQFMNSANTGDVQGLLAVLDPEATWYSDGGGMRGVAKKPIQGAESVIRFVFGLARLAPESVFNRPVEINGGPGVIIYVDGQPYTTLSFDFIGDRIKTIYAVVNPDKLSTLPPLSPQT
jgi:RNA polymerase sigma-70 factor (ECF subfamily)